MKSKPDFILIHQSSMKSNVQTWMHLIALLILLSNSIFAQTNFQADLLRNSHYYDSLISVRGIDSIQGTGYTQYQRWFRYWEISK